MKKTLLTGFGALAATLVFAQSNITISDTLGNDWTNMTVTYWVPCNAQDSRVFNITNIAEANITVKVQRRNEQFVGTTDYSNFCTGINCYSPAQSTSVAFTLAASGGSSTLTADYTPNDTAGTAIVRYTVIDQSNPADSSFIVIRYEVSCSPAGINPLVSAKPTLSNPVPNPASSTVAFDYNTGSVNPGNTKLVIYNMVGELVEQKVLAQPEGTLHLSVATMENGVYFCVLESQGKAISTHRLVVAH